MNVTSAGLSDRGCVRSVNQDRILCDDALALYVVCDGLGGRRRGDVAAELALNTLRQYVECSRDSRDVTWPYGYNLQMSFAANRVSTAAKLANRQVWKRSEESLEFLGMGTTIAAALLEPGLAAIANVGDTRIYLICDGSMEQISVDDSVVHQRPSPQDAAAAGAAGGIRSVLTRAAGSHEDVDVHLSEHAVKPGDLVLLASDGLHGVIGDDRIAALLAAAASPQEGVAALISAAKEAGGPDNISAVLVRIE
jgi:protein phosphatase